MRESSRAASVAALAIALALAACESAVSPRAAGGSEFDALVGRALALQERARSGEPASAAYRAEFDRLWEDVRSWSERTGRTDLSAYSSTGSPAGSGGEVAAAAVPDAPGTQDCIPTPLQPCCAPCPEITYQFGMICFLDYGSCDWSGRVCVYRCIRFPWQPPVYW